MILIFEIGISQTKCVILVGFPKSGHIAIHIMESCSQTDNELVIQLCDVSKCQFLTALLKYLLRKALMISPTSQTLSLLMVG